jgi:hypothetical protein
MKLRILTFMLLGAIGSTASGEWEKHVVLEAAGGAINSAVANDFDGDGHIDILSSHGGNVVLLRGPDWKPYVVHVFSPEHSRNRPRPACIHSCLLDVDRDGDMDFCGSNLTLFWLECPDEPFSGKPWIYRTIDDELLGTHCLITDDVNRDGKPDLIANSFRPTQTDFPNSIAWLETPSDKNGRWKRHIFADRDAPGGSHYMGLGDMNRDGRPDIACAAKGGEKFPGGEWFAWWEQPADPSVPWKKHLLAEGEVGATNILPVDLDGDGHLDFAASRGHGQGVLWFRGPEFGRVEIDPVIEKPHCLIIDDLDRDGDPDIATVGSEPDGKAVWYENDGKASFKRHDIAAGQGSYDLRTVDMDGDGDSDLLVAGHNSNNIVWFENPSVAAYR